MTYRRLLLTIASFAYMASLAAQLATGQWTMYNNYTSAVTALVDTPDKVYLVSDRNIFTYDKDADELTGHNIMNGLGDSGCTGLYRNYDRDYTVAAYDGGGLDVMYDDGTSVYMPDIRDSQSATNRSVNDVTFDADIMYVATGFGLVKYDMKRHAVIESGLYNQPVTAVTLMGDRLVICADGVMYFADKDTRITALSGFRRMGRLQIADIEPLTPTVAIAHQGRIDGGTIYQIVFDFDSRSFSTPLQQSLPQAMPIVRYGERVQAGNTYGAFFFYTDATGAPRYNYLSIPASYRINGYVAYNGDPTRNSMWYANKHGLGRATLAADYSAITPQGEQMRPFATSIDDGVGRLASGADGRIYIYNLSSNRSPEYYHINTAHSLNTITDGFIADLTPEADDVTVRSRNSRGQILTGFKIVEDPDDPDTYYHGTWFEGTYKITDGRQADKYDWRNTPIDSTYCNATYDMAIDTRGNLWMYQINMNEAKINVLPADKRRAGGVTRSDWTTISIPDFGTINTRNPVILPCRHSKSQGVVLLSEGYDNCGVAAYNTAGTISTTSDDTYRLRSRFTDQDGKTFGPVRIFCMTEDANGSVWVGCENGVFVIHNPAAMLTASATIERVKVPRNDGTQFADYLLESQTVNAIAIDGANRKWLSTDKSGVYLVSADGREIIEHFTTGNSPLPSNEIHDVKCDTRSNRVYIATAHGLACYSSTASPAAPDYSDVYAYPNPVRPDYTGWITIKGLMDKSLVKIADSAGNVLLNTRSEGGMVIWDGCNSSGRRVSSGVYFVYASQDSDGKSGAVVAKILVVN